RGETEDGWLLPVFPCWLVSVVAGNRCYVCVPRTGPWRDEALNLFPGSPELPLCEHFNPKDKRYERECPPRTTGCLIQSSGSHVLRTCSNFGETINDCKIANGVNYCSCSGSDLCNGDKSQTSYTVPQRPTDDEDQELPEGSGGGDYPQTNAYPSPTTAHPPHGTTTRSVTPSHGSATMSRTLGFLPFVVAIVTAAMQ
ncbi:uncharacterized protein LOC110835301, partial [Zootermopsis nevadensis]|uniref:uncharacterized protein LOC110835301 n=1 Tax=Zootermopsis nevadensis TaxID=136037 RepID=UPI000B8EBABE